MLPSIEPMKMQNACKALKVGPLQGIGKAFITVRFVLLALALAAYGGGIQIDFMARFR